MTFKDFMGAIEFKRYVGGISCYTQCWLATMEFSHDIVNVTDASTSSDVFHPATFRKFLFQCHPHFSTKKSLEFDKANLPFFTFPIAQFRSESFLFGSVFFIKRRKGDGIGSIKIESKSKQQGEMKIFRVFHELRLFNCHCVRDLRDLTRLLFTRFHPCYPSTFYTLSILDFIAE